MLTESTFQPLAQLAKKVKGEIKYHVMHADSFLKQLAKGTEESHARMQSALTYAMPYALGIFEKSEYEDVLIKEGVFGGEEKLQEKWLEKITAIVTAAGLTLPKVADSNIVYGGRKGYHSKYLEPLLDEMTEVTRSDPGAEW